MPFLRLSSKKTVLLPWVIHSLSLSLPPTPPQPTSLSFYLGNQLSCCEPLKEEVPVAGNSCLQQTTKVDLNLPTAVSVSLEMDPS